MSQTAPFTTQERLVRSLSALPAEADGGHALDDLLKPFIAEETELRRLFANDRKNARLADPDVGLVDLFDAPAILRTTRARTDSDDVEKSAKHAFVLPDTLRRPSGSPSVARTLDDFRKNWAIFTEGSLSQLTDWNNVIAAGGSVLGCLLPLADEVAESKRNIRKYFHSSAYPTSDVDLFLWGLTPAQAEAKIVTIYEAVRDSVPWEVTCIRTKHAITIYSQYPYRSVQIVLRLYQSPAEVLAGFDIDAACVAYDGKRVLANARATLAMIRQCNTVDMTRRSPSYEIRLAKYASRGFEISIPDLRREDIDPTIFERSINRIEGLARLLVLEKLSDAEARTAYLESRRALRGRPSNQQRTRRQMRRRRKYIGDLKGGDEIGGLEQNDYDVATVHIPYGPGWNARRIAKIIYGTDLGLNSTYNPKNKGRRLHRHPAFFGTIQECMEDCCEYCPEPENPEEKALQEEEDKNFIRGRIFFMQENPGRQIITGSFNPIDVGEWSAFAYIGVTEKFFTAIAALDRQSVQTMLQEGVEVNRRDHVGRTSLHLAIMVRASDICSDLIDAGARMSARLVDGRTSLHLAAQFDLPSIVEKMLQRSQINDAAAKAKEQAAKEAAKAKDRDGDIEMTQGDESERPSSDDDWESESEELVKVKPEDAKPSAEEQPTGTADIPEDNLELPDILDINAPDWDILFTPLSHAIASGSLRTVELLLGAGADPQLAVTTPDTWRANVLHPLGNTALVRDAGKAQAIVQRLLHAGALSSRADADLFSVFHVLVCSNRTDLVHAVLRNDPKSRTVLDIPYRKQSDVVLPLVTAIAKGNYSMVALLLAYGAKPTFTQEDWMRLLSMTPSTHTFSHNTRHNQHMLQFFRLPAEVSVAAMNDLVFLLADIGAQLSVPCNYAWQQGKYNADARMSIYDHVKNINTSLMKPQDVVAEPEETDGLSGPPGSWALQLKKLTDEVKVFRQSLSQLSPGFVGGPMRLTAGAARRGLLGAPMMASNLGTTDGDLNAKLAAVQEKLVKNYYSDITRLLEEKQAQTWKDLDKDYISSFGEANYRSNRRMGANKARKTGRFWLMHAGYGVREVPQALEYHYTKLFEACWAGNITVIQELCLPSKPSKGNENQPLQITVSMSPILGNQYADTYTPFAVAIYTRRWEVARVILAIAIAQYKKHDTEEVKMNTDIVLNDDESDDEENDDSDMDEDDDESQKETVFVDLANRPSALHVDVPPSKFFEQATDARVSRDGAKLINRGTVLSQAVQEGDQEAFVQILELMKLLPDPIEPDSSSLSLIISNDHATILDEFIRRTGAGINVDSSAIKEDTEGPVRQESSNYLGLNVSGKKRKDLAEQMNRENKFNATDNAKITPLLWQAAYHGSKKVIEYLCSAAPLNAFQSYAMSESTIRARNLRLVKDLEDCISNYIGIKPDFMNETSMHAALFVSKKETALPTVKQILSLIPAQAQVFLHSRMRVLNLSVFVIAVANGHTTELLDFLLANGVSADVQDSRGWNVYHYACANGSLDIISYLFGKLPQDMTNRLLVQTSLPNMNTPLMLAVKKARIDVTRLLVESNFEAVRIAMCKRDGKGSLPLHVAVNYGYAELVGLLTAAGAPDTLHTENGVGETPLDTATFHYLVDSTRTQFYGAIPPIPQLQMNHNAGFNVAQSLMQFSLTGQKTPDMLAKEIDNMRRLLVDLTNEGKFVANTTLQDALERFVNRLTDKLNKRKADVEASITQATTKRSFDTSDRRKTLDAMLDAVASRPGFRHLVHIREVLQSVTNSLEKSAEAKQSNTNRYVSRASRKKAGLPDEEDSKQELWQKSHIFGMSTMFSASGLNGYDDLV